MQKITKKSKLIAYACAGLGVNMLNIIVGSYLCSALLIGGFDPDDIGFWTYGNKDLVVAALWGALIVAAKFIDGLIDLPLSHFADHLKTRFGRRRPAIVMGFIPMIAAYVLFLIPINNGPTLLNTIWFAGLLMIFYAFYTLTMITYYATFAEICESQDEILLLSNVKSICDVVYFSLSFALVPVFVNLVDLNIRVVALLFLPLSLTMLIPLFMIKEKTYSKEECKEPKEKRTTFSESLLFTLKDKPFLIWLCNIFIMNIGLQLFLGGINEFFSTSGLDMTVVMASCFVPVPFTIFIYNHIVKKRGLSFGFRYILGVFSLGMALMIFCPHLPAAFQYPFAIGCSLIVSLAIGAFFAVTYTVPSQRAALRQEENKSASSMYFAIQGLFEGTSAGIASGVVLVFLKKSKEVIHFDLVPFMTIIVAGFCMTAFAFSFLLPKTIRSIGKTSAESGE